MNGEVQVSLADFKDWLEKFMDQPEPEILVRDLWGNITYADAGKVLTIAPSKLSAALDNPELRKHIVTPLE